MSLRSFYAVFLYSLRKLQEKRGKELDSHRNHGN